MISKIVKAALRNPTIILDKVREVPFSIRKLDWECISKPLIDSRVPASIHNPIIEDYMMTYHLDGKIKTAYDWWYSAVVRDREGKLYFLLVVFHPKWSFYRLLRVDFDSDKKEPRSLLGSPLAEDNFFGRIGYSKSNNVIDIWIHKTRKSESSIGSFVKCKINAGASRLILKTHDVVADLAFSSLGLPFWINKGRGAVSSPKGHKMSGFYDICKVDGSISCGALKFEISGVGINEHLMSFTPPDRFWKRVDGVFFSTDQIYCAFIYLENKIGAKQYEYKDGAIVLRTTHEYLIPIDFKIEYLEFDNSKGVPVKIRILAQTAKGELVAVAQAIVAIEKQLALKIVEGQFVFNDGSKLRLTNGYGQHALH